MTAIFVTGGKQYKVNEGDVLYIEKLDVPVGETVEFDQVLAVFENEKIKLGSPLVADVTISATVERHGKQKKIVVFKMKPKKNYRRHQGHRQPYTKIKIEKIVV